MKHAAPKVQARSNAAAASAGEGVPRIATTSATPSAAPTWRATEFRPVAVAYSAPGAEAIAAAVRFGSSVPAPSPRSTMPGSHSPTKSGVRPTRATSQKTAAPQSSPPATSTGRAPIRVTRLLVGPATAAAMNGPGVSARPASSTE